MRTMWLLGAALLAAGCGVEEPLHTEEPPRVLERVTKPVKKKGDGAKKKSGGGFGFDEKSDEERGGPTPTPENRMAPEMDDLERVMQREGREERPAGLWKCKRCGQEASTPGKCCGDDRQKIG
jgi:hypothetical protein